MIDQVQDEEIEAMKKQMIANGHLVIVDGRLDLSAAGREWLRANGVNVPDDKSLLDLGLEALVEEVVTEEMEKQAGRPTAGSEQ